MISLFSFFSYFSFFFYLFSSSSFLYFSLISLFYLFSLFFVFVLSFPFYRFSFLSNIIHQLINFHLSSPPPLSLTTQRFFFLSKQFRPISFFHLFPILARLKFSSILSWLDFIPSSISTQFSFIKFTWSFHYWFPLPSP